MYGLYLTLSSWVLFYVATHMSFFHNQCHLADLNTNTDVLTTYCNVRSLPCSQPLPYELFLKPPVPLVRHLLAALLR